MSDSSLEQSVYWTLYFGTLMSTGFYGITCMQTFFYFVHYHNDPLRTKIFVLALWVLNTVHDALIVSGAFKYILAGLTDPQSILDGIPELIIQILFLVLVAVPVQGFFVYRAYIFSGKNILAPLIWIPLAIYQLVANVVYVGKALFSVDGIRVVQLGALGDSFFMGLSISSLSVAAVADVLISLFLIFLLLRERTTHLLPGAQHVLQRLIVFAVNTGVWSALFALMTVILLHVYPTSSIYAVFGLPICSVYCNTVLANLNARSYIRREGTMNPHLDLGITSGSFNADQRSGETKLVHLSDHSPQHGLMTPPDTTGIHFARPDSV